MTSSTFLPSQYHYNDRIPEVRSCHYVCFVHAYRGHIYDSYCIVRLSTRRGNIISNVICSGFLTEANFSCSSAQDTLECLRAVDVNSLQSANIDINARGFFGTFVFVPVVDGSFITKRPTELMKAGKVNGVRSFRLRLPNYNELMLVILQDIVLAVTNTFEGTIFVNQNTTATVQVTDYVTQLFPKFGPQVVDAVAAQYAGMGKNIFQVNAIMGECEYPYMALNGWQLILTAILICPTYFLLRAFNGRAFKVGLSAPLLSRLIYLILSRVNSLYHLAYTTTIPPTILEIV